MQWQSPLGQYSGADDLGAIYCSSASPRNRGLFKPQVTAADGNPSLWRHSAARKASANIKPGRTPLGAGQLPDIVECKSPGNKLHCALLSMRRATRGTLMWQHQHVLVAGFMTDHKPPIR